MKVSAIIVTRGDIMAGDFAEIVASISMFDELLIWSNGEGEFLRGEGKPTLYHVENNGYFLRDTFQPVCEVTNLAVYGRYAAIKYARNELIYVQDDDVIVSDSQAIVDAWHKEQAYMSGWTFEEEPQESPRDLVVCNMPPEFRHDFYADHALVGFGAVFHRDSPARAFSKWNAYYRIQIDGTPAFNRACDVIFTALTPRALVDVPKTNMAYASALNRMWRQSSHVGERTRILGQAKEVRGKWGVE